MTNWVKSSYDCHFFYMFQWMITTPMDCRGGQEGQQESAKEDCKKAGWSSWMHILRNSLLVGSCLPALHLDLANVVRLMGMSSSSHVFSSYSMHKEVVVSYWLLFFTYVFNPSTRYACCRYILEGNELEFYQKKIQKKGKGAAV